MRCQKTLQVNM